MAKVKEKKPKSELKIVEEYAKKLLKLMGSKASVETSEDEANDAFRINIITQEERGLLIGNHGETMSSLQTTLGMMLKQKLGRWKRIIIDIGDWRQKQEEYLKKLALQTAERVKETGKPESLYNLNSSQRRIIHLALSNMEGIKTESTGEGEERYLIVKTSK